MQGFLYGTFSNTHDNSKHLLKIPWQNKMEYINIENV